MPRLLIIASTRPGRTGRPVANWFVDHAEASVNIPFVQQFLGRTAATR
jgi:hypothetical protein